MIERVRTLSDVHTALQPAADAAWDSFTRELDRLFAEGDSQLLAAARATLAAMVAKLEAVE